MLTTAIFLLSWLSAHASISPLIRGSAETHVARQVLNDHVDIIPPFEPLSCNKQMSACKSYKERHGTSNYKGFITIPCGECYIMDHEGDKLTFWKGLDIQGKLVFPENYSLHLVSPLIVVQGELVIRSTKAIDGKEQVIFTLTGDDDETTFTPIGENANKCHGNPTCEAGKKAFIVAGGKLDVRAIPQSTLTWGLLNDMIGDDTIVLDFSASNWAPGAEILITSHTREWDKHQVRKIESISTLSSGKMALKLNQTIVRPTTVLDDERFATEIALLSRNVLIQGGSDDNEWHGGHFMIHHTPEPQWIEGIEFRNMGQQGKLGRYPIHFHFCDDSPDSIVSRNTIRESNQRCVVVHGTNKLRVVGNIAYDTKGHCFMLEDGMETGNEFVRNLGAQTGIPETIIPDYQHNGIESDDEPATFWITNPTNAFFGNVAAGSASSGYWFEPYLRGERKHLYIDYQEPMYAPLGLFKENVAHSNVGKTGAIRMYVPGYLPEKLAVFEGIKSFRNDASGIFLHKNYNILIKDSLFADNNIGLDIDRAEGIDIENTLIIGESESYRKLMANQDVEKVCAFNKVIGIDLHTWTIFKGHGGTTLKNVEFQNFSDTACPRPRAINMDDHNIEQGQFEHFTSFENVIMSDKDRDSISFCDLAGTDIETVYLVDKNGDLAPSGLNPRSASSLLSTGENILHFVDNSNCNVIEKGCYTYCQNTCFQSLRYEIEGLATDNYELKVCDANDPDDCAFFFGSRRSNGNRNGNHDPRTFIAHVPSGRHYKATFLTNAGRTYTPTDLRIFYEESRCPDSPGQPLITLDGFTNPPSPAPTHADDSLRGTSYGSTSGPIQIRDYSMFEKSCFPGFSAIDVAGKGLIRMDELSIGDRILSRFGSYSTVISFAHSNPIAQTTYLRIQASSIVLHVSPDHFVLSNNLIVAAKNVRVGDYLTGEYGDRHFVEKISTMELKGAYAPITTSGDLVVDGAAVSNYVNVLDTVPAWIQDRFSHASYAFLRLRCLHGFCPDEAYNSNGIELSLARWIPLQRLLAASGSSFLQMGTVVLCSPIVVWMSAVERTYTMIPLVILLWAVLTYQRKRCKQTMC